MSEDSLKGDPALQSILNLDRYLRQQLLIWFFNSIIALSLLIFSFVKADSVASADRNRDYTPTNSSGELLKRSTTGQPADAKTLAELDSWVAASIQYCLTFDYQNYADVVNFCNTAIFSLNSVPNSPERRGHLFYKSLEQSGIVRTLMDNKTTMTIAIDKIKKNAHGLRIFDYISEDQNGEITNLEQRIYIYEYELTFRIIMQGQKLDAPIRYQVLVEKMSPLVREMPVGIRSIVSIE
ncbi:hypothetical protein M2G93_16860 [Vibrio vulnificus]|uniref:hypothetical protein n=1 Tax=Vibrio vulnificus TaxID=672 RepID=UPI0021DADE73|nr:hypothetical protein [Vibrio vulnificus]EKZ9225834.1 hypothetical protein [Vibrio vulnificus]ELC9582676.1 hypothetical protein [Vibrio vulnificus]MCU8149787.1 hypothetical protein [Vibrio vulnificus]MCU8385844.1 hypothetical protein [Vibrio vulnificus]